MLTLERVGHVAVATLSRPPVNALDPALIARLEVALEEAIDDPEVTVLHLRSEQKAFCAGADLALMRECFSKRGGTDAMLEVARSMQGLFARIEAANVVTLAEIGGAALGGGLELALACDLRVAANDAQIGLPEARLGLIPGAGGTQRLTRLCGRGIAARMMLSAEIISGAEAERIGLVPWSLPPGKVRGQAQEIAARCAALPRPALASIKRCIAAQEPADSRGYVEELAATRRLYEDPEARRRVAEFLDHAGGGRKDSRKNLSKETS